MSLNWWEPNYGSLGTIQGTGYFAGQYMIYLSHDANYVVFQKVTAAHVAEGIGASIKFEKSTGIWSDNNTAAWPAGARNSGNNVELE
ncbi:hypothetical protein, partial [Shewanella sp.]|uniref:hypothetical protein n=1 Tax=Shewanella sp. TaxID=50422 RepID=UPI004048DE8D